MFSFSACQKKKLRLQLKLQQLVESVSRLTPSLEIGAARRVSILTRGKTYNMKIYTKTRMFQQMKRLKNMLSFETQSNQIRFIDDAYLILMSLLNHF